MLQFLKHDGKTLVYKQNIVNTDQFSFYKFVNDCDEIGAYILYDAKECKLIDIVKEDNEEIYIVDALIRATLNHLSSINRFIKLTNDFSFFVNEHLDISKKAENCWVIDAKALFEKKCSDV
jgi:hypothetical protein